MTEATSDVEARNLVLIVDDELPSIALTTDILAKFQIPSIAARSGEEAITIADSLDIRVVILDIRMDGIDGMEVLKRLMAFENPPAVIMLTGHGTIRLATEAMKLGAYDFLTKPVNFHELGNLVCDALLEKGTGEPPHHDSEDEIIGSDPDLLRAIELTDSAASSDLPILIVGETGSGKELFAKRLHRMSLRSAKPFLVLNCGTLPEHLVESELFGHERGAFTGAQQNRKGLYETASGGSLFLDEIPELSKSAQVSMLRAAESGEFRRLGSDTPRAADVRLIAASALPLEDHVSQGSFREDLYFRLNGLEIHIPPLRERKDDIPALVSHFTEGIHHKGIRRTFSPPAITRLQEYDWPGNIRELRRAVERALVLCPHSEVRPDFVQQGKSPTTKIIFKEIRSMAEIDKEYILEVVRRKGGNLNAAARSLGISRSSLYRRLGEYGYKKGGEEEGRAKSEW